MSTAPEFQQRGNVSSYSTHDRWAEFSTLSCNVEARTFLRSGEVKVFFGTGNGTSMTIGLKPEEALALSRELALAAESLAVKEAA